LKAVAGIKDVPFAFDCGGFHLRVLEDVTDDIDGLGDALPEALRVVNSLLPRGVSVELSR